MKKRYRNKKKSYAQLVGAALVSAVSLPQVSWAQTAYANLRGTAGADAEVTAENVATGEVRRAKAGADGVYTLVGLPPGTYRVDAGAGTGRVVTLTVASTVTLDLTAQTAQPPAGTTLAEIVVNALRPIEVKTSEVGMTVSQAQIENLPQVSRNFLEFADTVPGIQFTTNPSGDTSITGGAQNASSVNVYIDGVGQKSYVKEGGVSGQFFTQGNPFSQLAISEYKVITSNYKAEYGQISSAAITAETKSGTNQFHGEVFDTYTNQNMRAETPSEVHSGLKTPSHEDEYGAAFGGPIIHDRMHFFVTYEAKSFNTPITVTPGGLIGTDTNTISLLPPSAQAQFGPADLPFTEHLTFGKVDWELSDRDRIVAESQYRQEDQIGNIGVGQAPSASIDTKNNDLRINARWQHSADRWYNEVLANYQDASNAPSSRGIGNGAQYAIAANNNQVILDTGPASPLATQNKGQRGPGIKDDLTFSNLRGWGDHTVKMGIRFNYLNLKAQDAEDINPQFYYDVNSTGTDTQPYKAFFTKPVPGLNPTAQSIDRQLGIYLQDDWAINHRLTMNFGVRWDYEQVMSYLDYVTPANVVAALNSQDPNAPVGQTYAQSLAKGGVNANDYISNGHNRKAPTDEIQPRLGFSYDLKDDQKHVVFGGYGRAYDRDLYDYLQLEQTKSSLPQFTVYFPSPLVPACQGTPCVAWDPAYLNGLSNLQALVAASNRGAEVDMINNNLKAPYSDQFSVGIRNKLGDWNSTVTFARIVSHDGIAFTLGNRRPDGSFWLNGGQPWGNGVPGFGSLIIASNGIVTRTNQVLVSLEKPYTEESGWGATFAYTFTDATQNRSITEHYAFDEENIAQYPFIRSNAAPRHRFVLTGTAKVPWGFVVGAKLTLATPTPYNDIAFGLPAQPNGAGGLPVSATPEPTFGYRDLDLQVTKNFKMKYGSTLYLRMNVVNVFNNRNYSDIITNWVVNGTLNPHPVSYNPNGNIDGEPRQLKLTAGVKF